ncbi:MAG: ATP-binding cassette domain-containing protein, partial [bacterium]
MMLEVRRLQKSFGSKIVLDNLSFNISKGEIYGLLGPNGAGKTTAINILCHLLAADDGEVKIANVAVDESVKYRMGVVPQEIAVYRDLTCRENLRFFGKLYGLHKPKIAEREQILIELFKLQSYQDSVVNQLSGGWQRRVNIA